jgi:wyosine [tRNA(Phe)-imidazoG37] synthetase (radical SAM superfamily)
LGINNIPPKICSYSCIYCQLGSTINMSIDRQVFYQPEEILRAVREKLSETGRAGEKVDYLTFVPDGEPTLDINLGRAIDLLRPLGIPIAVITNTSLLGQQEARNALLRADWVSIKIDSVEEKIWRRINRPHRLLQLPAVLKGALQFTKAFQGKLVSETMLVANVNDTDLSLTKTADFLEILQPATAYLSIPTRPPADKWVQPPDEHGINKAYQIFKKRLKDVEYLTGYEGNAFAFTGKVEEDILSITAVHPMRDDAVEDFLKRAGATWETINQMVKKGLLIETEYGQNRFYLRRFRQYSGNSP